MRTVEAMIDIIKNADEEMLAKLDKSINEILEQTFENEELTKEEQYVVNNVEKLKNEDKMISYDKAMKILGL